MACAFSAVGMTSSAKVMPIVVVSGRYPASRNAASPYFQASIDVK